MMRSSHARARVRCRRLPHAACAAVMSRTCRPESALRCACAARMRRMRACSTAPSCCAFHAPLSRCCHAAASNASSSDGYLHRHCLSFCCHCFHCCCCVCCHPAAAGPAATSPRSSLPPCRPSHSFPPKLGSPSRKPFLKQRCTSLRWRMRPVPVVLRPIAFTLQLSATNQEGQRKPPRQPSPRCCSSGCLPAGGRARLLPAGMLLLSPCFAHGQHRNVPGAAAQFHWLHAAPQVPPRLPPALLQSAPCCPPRLLGLLALLFHVLLPEDCSTTQPGSARAPQLLPPVAGTMPRSRSRHRHSHFRILAAG